MNQKGLVVMSLQSLADDLGLQTASFYYYFASKDALIEEVMRIGLDLVYQEVKSTIESLGPEISHREKIRAAIKSHLRSILTQGDYASAQLRNFPMAPESVRAKSLALRRQYGELWRHLLGEAQRAGELRPDADLTIIRLGLIGAMNWATEWFNPRKKSVDDIADVICNTLFDGVGTREVATEAAKTTRPRASGTPQTRRRANQ